MKRIPIELPPTHETAHISERVIAAFSNAVDTADKIYRSNPQKIAVETAHEALITGVEVIDGAEWRS